MATYTIVTTDEQEQALTWSYEQSQLPLMVAGVPNDPGPPQTQAEYLQSLVERDTLNRLVTDYNAALAADLVKMVATVPPENRPAALDDIEAVVIEHGGTVPLSGVPYLWSTNTAAPPRDLSIEANVTQPNMTTVTKLFIDHLDAESVDRMAALMTIPVGAALRIADPAVPASALVVRVATAPIQRQGADGYVELGVTFVSFAGAFADAQAVAFSVEG